MKGVLRDECAHVITGCEKIRARDRTFLDEFTHADVGVIRDARAACRRHAAFQGGAHRTRVADVYMRVDQAGHDVLPTKIKRFCATGNDSRADGFDPPSADDDADSALDRAVGDVEHVGVGKGEDVSGGWLGADADWRGGKGQ